MKGEYKNGGAGHVKVVIVDNTTTGTEHLYKHHSDPYDALGDILNSKYNVCFIKLYIESNGMNGLKLARILRSSAKYLEYKPILVQIGGESKYFGDFDYHIKDESEIHNELSLISHEQKIKVKAKKLIKDLTDGDDEFLAFAIAIYCNCQKGESIYKKIAKHCDMTEEAVRHKIRRIQKKQNMNMKLEPKQFIGYLREQIEGAVC